MVSPINSSNTNPVGNIPSGSAQQLEEVKVQLGDLVQRFFGLVGGVENVPNLPPKWQSYIQRGLVVASTVEGLTSADLATLPYNFIETAKRYLATAATHISIAENVKAANGWTDIISHLDEQPLVKALPKLLDHGFFHALENAEEVLHIG